MLNQQKFLRKQKIYKGAVNRSYYAIFHAMRTVLALDEVAFSKHFGVRHIIGESYIQFSEYLLDIIA